MKRKKNIKKKSSSFSKLSLFQKAGTKFFKPCPFSGKVVKTEEWGLRNFAYKIKNAKKGFYFHFKFEGVAKTIEELERTENIDEMLIRFLTIKEY